MPLTPSHPGTKAPSTTVRPRIVKTSSSGTRWSAGHPIGAESNPEFATPGEWAWAAQQMLREDAKLAGVSRMTHNALLSATWSVQPGSDSPAAERNAEYARELFGLEGRGCRLRSVAAFEDVLRPMMFWLDIGYRTLEELYYVEDGTVWLDGYGDMSPDTVQQWVRGEDERLLEVVQLPRSTSYFEGRRSVPASKLLVLTHALTGTAYEGTGLLRPCWRWWTSKRAMQQQLDVGGEKWANPSLKIKTTRQQDPAMLPVEQPVIDAMLDNAEQSAEDYLSGATTWLATTDAVDIETFAEGAYDSTHMLANIDHANQEMSTAYLAHFIELGLGDVGSRATGQVHWNAWRMSMVNGLDYLASAIGGPARPGGGTMARLLRWNFYAPGVPVPPSEMPRLVHTGLDVDGFADAAGILAGLAAAGILTPDDALEDRARRLLGVAPAERRPSTRRVPANTGPRMEQPGIPLKEDEGGRPADGPADEVQT